MKPIRTWILIADAGRARVLENLGPGKRTHEIADLASSVDLPKTSDLVRDRQPRGHESTNPSRHAIDSRSDPHDRLEVDHLQAIAARLDAHFESYDQLVVVAPPRALGTLRAAFTDRVKGSISAEIDKDLTKVPNHEIETHLADVVRF